ncbi:MAG TPA: PBSX family phage terminase large subunit [Pseudolabrys sp.]|nr:PBSX family phage terminase large subunit [Pseudolabrys sp.]
MTTLRIPTAAVFRPLLQPARYKGAYGGRGSGKSHFFGELLVETCLAEPGTSAVCIREVQRTLAQSSKRLIESKIESLGVGSQFDIQRELIRTPGDGLIIFAGLQDHTAESIKSLEGFRVAWIDEAQSLSARSLSLLRPTIRMERSEIWASWNPTRKNDAIDDFLRSPGGPPAGAIVVQANWRDNPFWTAELEAERKLELERYPERYPHTYEGEYAAAFEGAYFAKLLTAAKLGGRIGAVNADPLLPIRAYADIGGSGANADAFVFWICQFVDGDILILDHYETQGQTLAYHVKWLRDRGYQDAEIILPHDGVNENNVTGKRYEDHFRDAGFATRVIPNQGRGAAAQRIEAVRRLAPKFRFNAATTEAGRQALGFYHERKDELRNVGLGPDHDWSSHSADAFGLMAIDYREPSQAANFERAINYGDRGWR